MTDSDTQKTNDLAQRRLQVALFQPVLSHYRVDLFNELDSQLGGGLTIFTVDADESSNLGGTEDRLNAERREARTYRLGPLWFVPRALREVWSRRWDVVVLSWNVRQVELSLALLLAGWRRTPVVLWGHGFGRSTAWLPGLLRRWQVRRSATVVTYGERGADEVRAQVPGAEVVVLLNTTGRPAPAGSMALRQARRRVGYLGRLLPQKRIDVLINAVAILKDEVVDLEVEVVGDGPQGVVGRTLAANLGVSDQFRWHGQVTNWDQVRAIIAECDMVVLPTNAGLSVVDAFAAGRPVLVDGDPEASGPEADLVVDGDTGFRYGPAEASALATRLREIYEDPDQIVQASKGAIAVYKERLTMAAAATRFSEVLITAARPCARRC